MGRWQNGDRLGDRYVIVDRLTSGGMAEIYVAEMTLARQMRRRVALKRIHPHLADAPEFVTMFLDEARVCSQLVNPGIVPVLDAVECEGDIFLVLEYVPGWDLAALLKATRQEGNLIPLEAAVHVALSLASTLSYVHDAHDFKGEPLNIVHRDISPSNILLAQDGSVRLLDFGVARAAERLTRSPTNTLKGKFGYMAPEQIRGRAFDRRADLYALGLVMFEMVTGKNAIRGRDDVARLERARDPQHIRVSSIRPETNRALDVLIAWLLAIDPKARPETAATVVDELEKIRAELGGRGADQLRNFVLAAMNEPARPVGTSSTSLDVALAKAAGLTSLLGGRATAAISPTPQQPITPAFDGLSRDGPQGTAIDMEGTTEVSAPSRQRRLPRWLTIIAIVSLTASIGVGLLLAAGTETESSPLSTPSEPAIDGAIAQQGFLRLSTEPAGAKVLVDGEVWPEVTPTIVDSPSGKKRQITLELEDYLSKTLEIAAEPGATTPLYEKLKRLPGRLVITSNPEGAMVSVSGRDIGKAPVTINELPRAKTAVTLTLEGHGKHSTTARLDLQPEVELDITLKRRSAFGLLDVSSEPWARVKVGGRIVAESTPAMGIRLPAGSHTITLDNPRLGLIERRRVIIRDGKRSRLVVRLR